MNGVRISLLALFEFDTNHGHVPIAHHPTDDNAENLLKSLSREAFLKKSEKNGLQAITVDGGYVLVYYHTISDPRYTRNEFSFTLLLYLELEQGSLAHSLNSYLRVAAGMMRRLDVAELETEFVSRKDNRRERLLCLLEGTTQQLEQKGFCKVVMDENTGMTMNLRLEEPLSVIPADPVSDTSVLILRGDRREWQSCMKEDILHFRIIIAINGERTLAQVAAFARVDLGLARRAVCDLRYQSHFPN